MKSYLNPDSTEFFAEHLMNGEFFAPTAIGLALARSYRFDFTLTDPLGMYTGNPTDGGECPVQDADDL